jgi:hypothetical protein
MPMIRAAVLLGPPLPVRDCALAGAVRWRTVWASAALVVRVVPVMAFPFSVVLWALGRAWWMAGEVA